MKVQRKHKSRRGGRLLAGLLTLVLLVAVAYGGARLWQGIEDGDPAPKTEDEASAKEGSPFGEPEEPDPLEEDLDEDASSVSAQFQAPVSFQADLTGESQGDADFSGGAAGEPVVENTVTGDFAVEGQVPEAATKMTNSYFDDAIFFGDSISTGITAYNIANNTACIAAIGVSPSTVLNTAYIPTADGSRLTVLDAAKQYGERSKVYIMLGGNGLWQELDSFISDYQKFIDAVKEQYPGAVIYLQSMTPVGRGVEITYPSVTHQKVLEYNAAIAKLAGDNALPFVNVFEALCGADGYLPDGVSGDGLHLSPEYYFKWFDYLKSHTVEA